jgi:hypothetical protein
MTSTAFGVVVRQQAWFRPLLDLQDVSPFPVDEIDAVPLHPASAFRARVLLGRGPVERDLAPEFFIWFEHGVQEYPVFESPSIGPKGAALKFSSKPRSLTASVDEALGLIEISLIQPVHESFREQYEAEQQPHAQGGPGAIVRGWLREAKKWLEQAVGLYALYQYSVVWEPLGVHHLVGFVDLKTQTFHGSSIIEPDNFIPFRLNPAARLKGGQLADDGLIDFPRLADCALHFPLFLLQRALWQTNVQLRFLETFLLLDYLTGQSEIEDPSRTQRERLYEIIETCVRRDHPEHEERVTALKHVVGSGNSDLFFPEILTKSAC